MPKKTNEEIQQSLLDKGVEIIISAFNEQKNEFTKAIYELETENNKLKEENNIYKNKLSILHKKLSKISKTFCDLDMDDEESKIQTNDNQITLNNFLPDSKKNNFINRKSALYKNFLSQNKNSNYSSFQGETKYSHMPKRAEQNDDQNKYHSNYHYNLKYILNQQNNDFNKMMGNLNYLKKRKNNSKNKNQKIHTNNSSSYLIENNSKELDINNYNESKTDREYKYKKGFSEKYLNIKKNQTKILNNNDIISENINDNINNKNDSDINTETNKFDKIFRNSSENSSSFDKKLKIFLEKCKVKLNALDYEKIINLFKSFENNSSIDIRKKVKKIINNNQKLCNLFDDIFFNQVEN